MSPLLLVCFMMKQQEQLRRFTERIKNIATVFLFYDVWLTLSNSKQRYSPNSLNTLCSQAMLTDKLLENGYGYVMKVDWKGTLYWTPFFSISPNAWWELVSEFKINIERIISCQSLIKEEINFWQEELNPEGEIVQCDFIDDMLPDDTEKIFENVLDEKLLKYLFTLQVAVSVSKKLSIKSEDLQNESIWQFFNSLISQ